MRELAPGAARYLAENSRYTARDIAHLTDVLGFDEPKDKVDFYEQYLKIVEAAPFVAPMIDIVVARERVEKGLEGPSRRRGRRGADKSFVGLSRLNMTRLRLANIHRVEERLGDLVNAEIGTDLAVGMFCEYALFTSRG